MNKVRIFENKQLSDWQYLSLSQVHINGIEIVKFTFILSQNA